MADESLAGQITRMELIILGGEDWVRRAREGMIRRTPEQVETRLANLTVERAILRTLQRLQAAEKDPPQKAPPARPARAKGQP